MNKNNKNNKDNKKNNNNFNPLGGMFDFNKDGKTDMAEMWIAKNMYEDFKRKTGK